MPANRKRVILDTNIWISFLLSDNLNHLEELVFSGKIKLVFSQELIEEFVEVVRRPKFKDHISKLDIEFILLKIQDYADFINVKSKVTLCRDKKDNFLLSLSIDGKADFLITGDQDLLILGLIKETKIMTVKDFCQDILI